MTMKKILLVDDDHDLLRIVRHVLTTNGYDITTLSEAERLWGQIKVLRPDLIILDQDLGNAEGTTICRQLKDNTDTTEIPVLVFSAEVPDKDTRLASGAAAFIQKPVSSENFLKKINELLSGTQLES